MQMARGWIATSMAQSWHKNLEQADRARLIEMIEMELLELHAGNIQRYKVSQNQFEFWQSHWLDS